MLSLGEDEEDGRELSGSGVDSMRLRSFFSPLVRAFFQYLFRTADIGIIPIVLLKDEVEDEIEDFTEEIFADIERSLANAAQEGTIDALDEPPRFCYDTRLLLPAMLALGRVHIVSGDVPILRRWRSIDRDLLERGQDTTYEIVQALLDGDMRDALNDGEFEDFETNAEPKERVADIAQRMLQKNVESWLDRPGTPEDVRTHYRHAVNVSERHQDADNDFRDLLNRLRSDHDELAPAVEEVRERYKFAELSADAPLFASEHKLPYFATQYERVGIIYEDMLNMYEADLGHPLGENFKRSIVLMVIAAQIGLDDTDDYPEDRGVQLTPVTAEIELKGLDGVDVIEKIVELYLERASRYSDDHLSGMAISYIREQAIDRLDRLRTEVA